MGEVLKKLGWRALEYVVSTKFFWGMHDGPNEKNTLNRKYLLQAIDGSLKRLQTGLRRPRLLPPPRSRHADRGDGVGDARHDRARQGALLGHLGVERGRDPRRLEIAERHHLHKPVMEQPQYNLLQRERVEKEYARLYERHRPRPHHLEPAGLGPADRQVQRRHPGRAARRAQGLRVAARALTEPAQERGWSGDWSRSPTTSAARWRSSPLAWCLKNPNVSARSSPAPPASSRCPRT